MESVQSSDNILNGYSNHSKVKKNLIYEGKIVAYFILYNITDVIMLSTIM